MFATATGGFWVVRIEQQVRRYLGLTDLGDGGARRLEDAGHPGTAGASLAPLPPGYRPPHHPC